MQVAILVAFAIVILSLSLTPPSAYYYAYSSSINSTDDNDDQNEEDDGERDQQGDETGQGEELGDIFGDSGNDDDSGSSSSNGDDDSDDSGPLPTVVIDPSSSDSLLVLSHRISTNEMLDRLTMHIDGEIENNGTESLDFVKVTATFYDATNSILGSEFAFTEPYTLEPGQTAPFKLTAGYVDNVPVDEIASIKLHVNGS